jgi:hypothetical protein
MAMPLGGNAKLAFDVEDLATYGTPMTFDSGEGLRVYYDSFSADARKEPEDVEEISGVSIDRSEFVEGAIIVGGTLSYRVRYYGGHVVLMALAMGDVVQGGSSPTYSFQIDLADDLRAATVLHQVPVIISGATAQRDNIFAGMKVARSVWSQRSGESMRHSLDFIGSYVDYDTSPETVPGPLESGSGGRYPTENYVHWSHEDQTTYFQIKRDGQSAVQLLVHSWELVLDNALARQFRIQNGRKGAEPPRDGFREVTLRMEVEQDDGWQEAMDAYGYLNTQETEPFSIIWKMLNSGSTDFYEFQISNCRTLDVPRGISSPRSVRQTIEARAHYTAGGSNYIANPLRIYAGLLTSGPSGGTETDYEDFFDA